MRQKTVRVRKKRPVLRFFIIFLSSVLAFFLILEAGVFALHYKEPYKPDYKKLDISALITNEVFTEEDYSLLFKQTGLTRLGIDSMVSANRREDILKVQADFFADYPISKTQFSPLTCCHVLDREIETAPFEEGDIIISLTSHFSFFEMGHAAIVVDAAEGIIMNATGYNNISCFESVSGVINRPDFVILRLKADKETRSKIAKNAAETLLDLNYSVSIGILGQKYVEKPIRTNCSHLVWHAFKTFGYDLDSNGGPVVMPIDIMKSDELELVQTYGIDPETL